MPGSPLPALSKSDLFARLAQGHAAAICVVTPNRRLAQTLRAEFNAFQIAQGRSAWEDADILPLGAFAARLYEDALYAADEPGLPHLLSEAQAEALWASLLEDSGLVAVHEAAAECGQAWMLAHQWGIAGALEKFAASEDTAAFARWAAAYARRCDEGGLTDAARLPELGARLSARAPKVLVAYGFGVLPPQVLEFFGVLKAEVFSSQRENRKSRSLRAPFPSAAKELEAAARWARARLETGAKRIGIVVPDLELRRREVVRIFSGVMRPAFQVPGAPPGPLPFNVSLGERLDAWPVVDAALGILEVALHEVPYERASRVLRSPFVSGAEAEQGARALLDARLRRRMPARVSLGKLVGVLEGSSRSLFEKLFQLKEKANFKNLSTHQWAQHFTALLDAAGFPGDRGLDSAEFQAEARFNEALGELSRLSRVLGEVSAGAALAQLRRLCAGTLFQPETPEVPVQVLGVLESAGMEFDCLWVSGLTENAWPQGARPHPFLAVALQKKAGIPQASAEGALALARELTAGWLGAADEVVLSWPEMEEDRVLLPTPLIAGVAQGTLRLPAAPSWRDQMFKAARIESVVEANAALAQMSLRGGTRVLADQAACPFRAFARHRLGAEALEAPAEGLDARGRGILLHTMMAEIWREVRDSAGLAADLRPVIERAAAAAVDEVRLEGRFAELERIRLAKLAREWLDIERARPPFEVMATEERRALKAGPLEFTGRIDRMDRLADGTYALIDYKSAKDVSSKRWLGPRPDEPQLPLYAVSAPERIGAVAFAKLRVGDTRFSGFSLNDRQLPGVKPAKSWPGLMEGWRQSLDRLATEFATGEAKVDPKPTACRNCDLQALCRVAEKKNLLEEEDEE